RVEYGMSQSELAERLGVSRPTVARIEEGGRKLNVREQKRISEIFELVSDVDDAFKSDVRINIPQQKLDKFKQVLLYVLEKTGGKPNVGMTVLYKLLYFIDFDYYEKYHEQLMGLTYIKNHHGPTPKEFVKVVEDMKENGEIEEIKSKYFKHDQKKFLPISKSDLSVLSVLEKEMIDNVLLRYSDKSATELSNLSHIDTPWAVAEKQGDVLEYEHVFYRPAELSVGEYDEL
ncbi:type II toxin-antitoxin system antitoxin SocA domain-containing protein, partial [Patescibacteria group bacterium]